MSSCVCVHACVSSKYCFFLKSVDQMSTKFFYCRKITGLGHGLKVKLFKLFLCELFNTGSSNKSVLIFGCNELNIFEICWLLRFLVLQTKSESKADFKDR